jgi:hypothetical protein
MGMTMTGSRLYCDLRCRLYCSVRTRSSRSRGDACWWVDIGENSSVSSGIAVSMDGIGQSVFTSYTSTVMKPMVSTLIKKKTHTTVSRVFWNAQPRPRHPSRGVAAPYASISDLLSARPGTVTGPNACARLW